MDLIDDADELPPLPPAASIDRDAVSAALAALAGTDEDWRLEDLHGVQRTMLSRVADAIHPHLRDLAFRARAGTLTDAEGVSVRPVAFPTAWHAGFALERPGEPGYLFAVALRPPLDGSGAVKALLDQAEAEARAKHAARGLSGVDLDRAALSARIVAEIRLEEDVLSGKVPADLPDPTGTEPVEMVHVVRYAPAPGPAPEGEDFPAFAARMRPCVGTGLDKAVAAVAGDGYAPDAVLKATPARLEYGSVPDGPATDHVWDPPSFSTVTASIADWAQALDRLRAVAGHAGILPAISRDAAAVAARRYSNNGDPGPDRYPDLIGASLATCDAGLPSGEATAWISAFEGRLLAARFGDMAEAVGRLSEGLADLGHTEGHAIDFNDLDDTAETTRGADGPETLMLTEQNGEYLVVIDRDTDGAVSGLGIARHGRPIADYLRDRRDPRDRDALGYREFHRGYANPADPEAPLPLGEARARLAARDNAFPGLVARFERGPDGFARVAAGPYSLRTVRDGNNVSHLLGRAMHAVREELETRSAPAP